MAVDPGSALLELLIFIVGLILGIWLAVRGR
jgi:hypothetical protein